MTVPIIMTRRGICLRSEKESGKSRTVEGIQLGLNSGSLIILAICLLQEYKGPRVLIHYSAEIALLLKLLSSCLISELWGSKKFFTPQYRFSEHLLCLDAVLNIKWIRPQIFAVYSKGWPTFSVKSQIVNVLGFLGHIVPVTITQLWI